MKFSELNADFSRPSPYPLGLRRLAQAGVKDGYPTMLLIITSTGDRLFRFINIDDLRP